MMNLRGNELLKTMGVAMISVDGVWGTREREKVENEG